MLLEIKICCYCILNYWDTPSIGFWRRATHLVLCFLYNALFSSVEFLLHLFFNLFLALLKKWGLPLRISSVNVTKSAGNCGFGHIYWRNLNGKLHFLCSVVYISFLSSLVINGVWLFLLPLKVFFFSGRSSRLELFCKNGALENLTKLTGKYLCQSLFFDKVASLRPFLIEYLRWLLL